MGHYYSFRNFGNMIVANAITNEGFATFTEELTKDFFSDELNPNKLVCAGGGFYFSQIPDTLTLYGPEYPRPTGACFYKEIWERYGPDVFKKIFIKASLRPYCKGSDADRGIWENRLTGSIVKLSVLRLSFCF
ncbi:MAG: hypothetical protein IT289_06630 [Oligoflexia bacterium]|nr:hypothetical protein [Oligoflexia bacterium]